MKVEIVDKSEAPLVRVSYKEVIEKFKELNDTNCLKITLDDKRQAISAREYLKRFTLQKVAGFKKPPLLNCIIARRENVVYIYKKE